MTSTFPPPPSQTPPPGGPPAGPPVGQRPRRRPGRRLVLLIAGIVLVLVAAAVVAIVFLTRDSGVDHPDAWDEQVADLIPIVEEGRGLEFEHPVHVDFLSEEEFRNELSADEGDLTDEDREEIEQTSGLLRALGLLKGDVDLFEEMNSLTTDATLGFYSFEDERIRVRGSELTPAVTKTLVHELTHALQDQHFDLGKRFEEFDESDEATAASVFRGVVEGDASRVETAYVASLPPAEQEELTESSTADQEEMLAGLEDIPEILVVIMGTPYALGQPLVTLAYEKDGNKSVDAMFRKPPYTEEHLLDPWTWLLEQEAPLEVEQPSLDSGEEEFDSGEFGALFLYFVLAEQLPLTEALDAADGWGGDHYVAFERGEQTCITSDFVGDTAKDLTQMHEALTTWSEALPEGAATVTLSGDRVRLESCDSGKARVGSNSAQDALQLVTVRSSLAAQLRQTGAPPELARCFADAVSREFSVDQLIDPTFGADDPKVQQRIQQLVMSCA